ncbi:MAG: tripartite tricarboxylate transporter substrate binding protein [Burkholderiales bacterium]|nr:tripartite tricarboxylate transporter substrate binding protein [Burkholderiales bacterium]
MNQMTQRSFLLLTALAAAAGGLPPSAAQDYPTRPVRVIVPHEVGGASDIIARAMGQQLGARLGQPFVVENRVGANGIIGLEACAKAAPDGHTLCVSNMGAISINPVIYTKLAFDPLVHFAPVANIGAQAIVLMVHPSVPAASVQELLALAKARPGALTWASLGFGSHQHIYVEWFRTRGIAFHHVPYKSGPQALTAAVAGEVQVVQIGTGQAIPLVRSGKLKGLAVTSGERSSFIPELPSYGELGLELRVSTWNGVFAPRATPAERLRALNTHINRLFADPDFKAKVLDRVRLEPTTGTPEEFAAFLKADRRQFEDIARAANIRPD